MLIEHEGMSVNAFSKKIGFNQSNLSKVIREERDVPLSLIDAIVKRTDIRVEWLLTGEGEMLKGTVKAGTEETPKLPAPVAKTKPRLPVSAAAGMISEYIGGIKLDQCEQMPVIPRFPAYDFTMKVEGDSMEPKFKEGDEIACTKVYNIIEWGKAYLIDTKDGAFLKRIYDEGDSLRCVSYNSEYPDFKVPKIDINGIYRVVGLLRTAI